MKLHKVFQIIGISLIGIGLVGVTPIVYFRYTLSKENAAPTVPQHVESQILHRPEAITGTPDQISIPSLSLTVPIVDGIYSQATKQWTLGLSTAQFATITTPPNNLAGDTYIYGHYRPEVFAYLHHIKSGATAVVRTKNGYEFSYILREKHDVQPGDTSIFAYQGSPILTLQTCSGTWFQNRQQYTFDFVSYKKI